MKPLSVGVALFGLLALVQPAIEKNFADALFGVRRADLRLHDVPVDRDIELPEDIRRHLFDRDDRVRPRGAGRPGRALARRLCAISAARVAAADGRDLLDPGLRGGATSRRCGRSCGSPTAISTPTKPDGRASGRSALLRPLERRIAVAMVVVLVLINQAEVGITVRLNFFNRDWFDAIQNRDAATFWQQLLFVFTPWAFVYVAMTVVEFFMQSMLVIRWRRWLTDHFVSRWLADHNHYRISLVAGQTDNPDQRIAEDVYRFINGGSDGSNTGYGIYDFSILLISTVSSLVSFAIVLWGLSTSFTLPGTDIVVPGFLFWVALIYAAAGTLITHLIGRPLIRLYFQRQHMEADFRFSLARLREYTEQVALLGGENAEQGHGRATLRGAHRQLSRSRLSTHAGDRVHADVRPDLADHPLHLHGAVLFRRQDRARRDDANRRRVRAGGRRADLLRQLLHLPRRVQIGGRSPELIRCGDRPGAGAQPCRPGARCECRRHAGDRPRGCRSLPAGRQAHRRERSIWRWRAGESVALSGPSGSGKSTLFRAISGIWPFGEGRIQLARGHSRHGRAAEAVYSDQHAARRRHLSGGARHLFGRRHPQGARRCPSRPISSNELDHEEVWSQRLSSGEQQRVALARALLMRPDWLFLDESTSAVEEKLEAELYAVLARRLPNTTIVSIGHRSAVVALHQRHLEMSPEDDHFTLRDAAKVVVAE